MRSSAACRIARVAVAVRPSAGARTDRCANRIRVRLPGYRYEFPRDHFDHPEFQTEWWYYTGNVKTPADGHRLVSSSRFFGRACSVTQPRTASWDVRDLYLAHLALSDLDRGGSSITPSARIAPVRASLGVSAKRERIWNGNWQIVWKRRRARRSRPSMPRFELQLTLHSEKAAGDQRRKRNQSESARLPARHRITFR